MNKFLALVLAAGAVLFFGRQSDGGMIFQAIITHDQEVVNPGIPDEGSSGIGIFELNDAQTSLRYSILLSGLDLNGLQTPGDPNDNVTRTHIHAAAAGVNGGIVFGQIDGNAAFRNDLDDLFVNPVNGRIRGFWDNNEGNGTTLALQLANLLAGNLYFNVHTSDHAGGEIRGQILLIPEPASSVVFLLGCGLMLRRRR